MPEEKFIDLEEVILHWADREYDKSATRNQRRLKEKQKKSNTTNIQATINWSKVKISDVTTWQPIYDDVTSSSANGPAVARLVPIAAPGGKSSLALLFSTSFINNTDEVQEYTMKTEKTTRSSATSELETGYTKGIEMSVKLTTPCQIFESSGGFKREFSLTKVEGQSFDEELTWGVESVINVKSCHVAEASLVVDEKKLHGGFEIESRLNGMVIVTFTNLTDNNSFIKMTGHELGIIVKEYLDREKRKGKDYSSFIEVTPDLTVVTRTKGNCSFRYGVKQEIVVNQWPI